MPTCLGDQASPEQPSTSVSLLDDELMSLGEEGAGPREGQARLRGVMPTAHMQLTEHGQVRVSLLPPVLGSVGDGLEAHSQLRKLRLREARNLCKVASSKGEVGQALNLISQQHPDISLQQVRAEM